MKLKLSAKICLGVMAFTVCVVLAINITCGIFYELITGYFHGVGISFEGEEIAQALEQSDALGRQIMEEGVVLVKNDGLLPMSKSELSRLNVFGWRSINNAWIGGSSGSVNANNKTTLEKIRTFYDMLDENDVEYNEELREMYKAYYNQRDPKALEVGVDKYFIVTEPGREYYGDALISNAVDFSDTAVVILGRLGGEGCDLPLYQNKRMGNGSIVKATDRTYLDLSSEEEDMLDIVTKNFENVIVVVNSVNEINYSFTEKFENIDAVLSISGGTGQSGVYALYRILRGKVNPSGRFAATHPYDFSSDPTFCNVGANQTDHSAVYAENIYVGYKWYETADAEGYFDGETRSFDVKMRDGSVRTVNKTGYDAVVQFPFGYGLSYTNFEWEVTDFTVGDSDFDGSTKFSVEVTVTNTGDFKGKDVVELYYTPPYNPKKLDTAIEKAHVNLLAYAKTGVIPAGESETVTLEFTGYDMASYDCYDRNKNGFSGYELEAGDYTVSLRRDSHTLADCENAEIVYTLGSDVKIAVDPITRNAVENRFTGDAAYADCPIDGSKTDPGEDSVQSLEYLTRKNFAATFPKHVRVNGNSLVTAATKYVYPIKTEETAPTLGSGKPGELLLYTTEDGKAASEAQLHTGEGLKINHDLMMELGADYESPKWGRLLDQMSADEMSRLIELGGYCTREIESIGKKYFLDNDGGSGLNRHIQQSDASNPDRNKWTLFPMPSLIGCSWNDYVAYSLGLAVAAEGSVTGINGWYAPQVNMQRSPFDGRNSEYISEDPVLSGKITAATVRGAVANGMYTYVKHFAVNETETNRTGLCTWLTEQTLREIYLKPFEIVVKEGKTSAMMTSFNRLGATWTGGNRALMTDILRDEWGFRGATVTDYYAAGNMPLKQGLYAGQDLWLTGSGLKVGGFDSLDATFMTAARNACKNIVYSRCNAYWQSQTHDSSEDIIKADTERIVVRYDPFPAWIFILVAIDLVAVAGITLWLLAIFKPQLFKRKRAQAVISVSTNDGAVNMPLDSEAASMPAEDEYVAVCETGNETIESENIRSEQTETVDGGFSEVKTNDSELNDVSAVAKQTEAGKKPAREKGGAAKRTSTAKTSDSAQMKAELKRIRGDLDELKELRNEMKDIKALLEKLVK